MHHTKTRDGETAGFGLWAAVYCPSSAERGSPIYPVSTHSKEAADRSRCDPSSAAYGPVPGGNS